VRTRVNGREARYVATGGRRVVVIDDDPSIREVAALALTAVGGHEVHTAGDGTEGLEVARRVRPDAILLDVMMPVHDGPAVLGRLRALPELRDVPVVFLTAKVGTKDISRLDGVGAVAVITKPFDPLGLAGELAAVLGWDA
jgi:CheY-like chemotaxis protein